MKNLRSISIVVVICFLMISMFAGCGTPKATDESTTQATASEESKETTAAEDVKKEPVTLSVLINKDWNTEHLQAVFTRYQEKSGNKLDLQVTAGGAPFNDTIAARSAANDLPDILFYYGMQQQLKDIRVNELLLDITNEAFMQKVSPSILNVQDWLRVDGKLYMVPASGLNSAGAIYNKKVWADNGLAIPTTMDEFYAVCDKLKAAGITPITESLKDGWPPLLFYFSAAANQIQDKPEVIEKLNTGKYDYTKDQEFKLVLSQYKNLFDKGYMNKDAASATYDMQQQAFATGKTGMLIQADWAIPAILTKFPDVGKDIGMFALPFSADPYVGISDPWAFGLAKNGKNVEAAKTFAEYFTSDENLTAYYSGLKAIPCYTGVKADLNPGSADIAPYVDSGKARPFISGVLKVGPNFDWAALALNAKSIDKILDETQKDYLKRGKELKIAGF